MSINSQSFAVVVDSIGQMLESNRSAKPLTGWKSAPVSFAHFAGLVLVRRKTPLQRKLTEKHWTEVV